jgi:hypothetical protein
MAWFGYPVSLLSSHPKRRADWRVEIKIKAKPVRATPSAAHPRLSRVIQQIVFNKNTTDWRRQEKKSQAP